MVQSKGIVKAVEVVTSGAAHDFTNTLTLNGGIYNLTGKTVQATIRDSDDPDKIIDDTLENIAVTLDDAAAGDVITPTTVAMTALLKGHPDRDQTRPYWIQYHITTDNLYSQKLEFGVRGAIG